MEMFTTLLLFVVAVVIVVYLILVESTDWIGRAEIIEKRSPRLAEHIPDRYEHAVHHYGLLSPRGQKRALALFFDAFDLQWTM